MLTSIFACPLCHQPLTSSANGFRCRECLRHYPVISGIPNFIPPDVTGKRLNQSQNQYEQIHEKPWSKLTDGSYEILAAIARGNRSVDIACGDGFIEELVPTVVGVDFSRNALLKAKKRGAKHLLQATAEYLPFKDNSFDLAICAGSLEHFTDPEKAVAEMVRVSQIQLLTVHATFPGRDFLVKILRIREQPIEKPLHLSRVEWMLKNSGSQVVFKGVWTIPLNYGRVVPFLPELNFLPTVHFVIAYKA